MNFQQFPLRAASVFQRVQRMQRVFRMSSMPKAEDRCLLTLEHSRILIAHLARQAYPPGVPSRLPQCISGKSNRSIAAAIATTSAIIA